MPWQMKVPILVAEAQNSLRTARFRYKRRCCSRQLLLASAQKPTKRSIARCYKREVQSSSPVAQMLLPEGKPGSPHGWMKMEVPTYANVNLEYLLPLLPTRKTSHL